MHIRAYTHVSWSPWPVALSISGEIKMSVVLQVVDAVGRHSQYAIWGYWEVIWVAQVHQACRPDVGDDSRTRGLARRGAYDPHTILLSLLSVSWVGSDAWSCSPDVSVHTPPAGRHGDASAPWLRATTLVCARSGMGRECPCAKHTNCYYWTEHDHAGARQL